MKIFIRTVWSNYKEITLIELQYRIDSYYAVKYVIDEITENCIYVCEVKED